MCFLFDGVNFSRPLESHVLHSRERLKFRPFVRTNKTACPLYTGVPIKGVSVERGFTVLHTLPLVVNAAWIHKQRLCCFRSSECYRWTRRTQAQARNSCCCIVPGRLVVSCLHSENKVMIRIKLNFVKHLRKKIRDKRKKALTERFDVGMTSLSSESCYYCRLIMTSWRHRNVVLNFFRLSLFLKDIITVDLFINKLVSAAFKKSYTDNIRNVVVVVVFDIWNGEPRDKLQ